LTTWAAANFNSGNGFADAYLRTVAKDADGSGRAAVSIVRANPLNNHGGTVADGAHANITPHSAHTDAAKEFAQASEKNPEAAHG
jgi:hypothetical protein